MNYEARRRELLIRRRRDTWQELAMLNLGELWHVLAEKQYRRINDTPPVTPPRTVTATSANPVTMGTNAFSALSGNLGSVTITPTPGSFAGFEMLSLNVDISDNTLGANELHVIIEAVEQNGDPITPAFFNAAGDPLTVPLLLDESGVGSQRIRIESTMGEIFTSVTFLPLGGAMLEQVRLEQLTDSFNSSITSLTTHTPEPASLAMRGIGIAVFSAGVRASCGRSTT